MSIDPITPSQVHAATPNIGIAHGFCSPGFTAEPGAARAGQLRLSPLGQPAAMPLRAQEGQPRAGHAVRMDTAAFWQPHYEPSHDSGYTSGSESGYTASHEPGHSAGYEHNADPGGVPNDEPGHHPAQHTSDPGHGFQYRTDVSSGYDFGDDARSDLALAHPTISRPAMGPAQLTSTALVVYEQVRSHYQGKAKSGNKLRVSSDPANQRALADYERWQRAADLLAPLHAAGAPIQDLMEAGVGNCDDLAGHAALLAREAGLKATLWGMWDAQGNAGYHCFCVVSAPGETGSPFEGGAARHGVNLVLDPWSGVIDRVENYGPRMAAKMHKWAREGKQIHCANLGGWIAATDPRWLDVVAVPRPFPIPF